MNLNVWTITCHSKCIYRHAYLSASMFDGIVTLSCMSCENSFANTGDLAAIVLFCGRKISLVLVSLQVASCSLFC